MSELNNDVNARLLTGLEKYGHGVKLTDNMSFYTVKNKDSFLEMQKEEILDGIIYTAASFLRWTKVKYGAVYNEVDNNKDILSIIFGGIHMHDKVSLYYSRLLENMKKIYRDTVKLENLLEEEELIV